ncbi:hypothetical protein AB0M46_04195 [Dactylosporangium sp. NPDC051485]
MTVPSALTAWMRGPVPPAVEQELTELAAAGKAAGYATVSR